MSKDEDQSSCKKNASTAAEQKSCSEEKAMKCNTNASSPEEIKDQAKSSKKTGKVAEKPYDYVVDSDENVNADTSSDKFGTT